GSRDRPAGPDQIADEPEPDCLYCGGFIQSGLVASTSGSVGSVAVALLDIASKRADRFPKLSTEAIGPGGSRGRELGRRGSRLPSEINRRNQGSHRRD